MKKYLIGLASCLMLFAACEDKTGELDNLNPDGNGHRTFVSVKNSGKQYVTLYNTGENSLYSTSFVVTKSGEKANSTATARLQVMSQADVDAIYSAQDGKIYNIITTDCYTLKNTEYDFTPKTDALQTDIIIKPEEIMKLDRTKSWVLPLEVVSETDSVDTKNSNIMFVIEPGFKASIGFDESDNNIVVLSGEQEIQHGIEISMNMTSLWDVEVSLCTLGEDYVTEYNSNKGTSYTLLPKGYILPETVTIEKNSQGVELNVSLSAAGLELDNYLLPIEIKATSQFDIDQDAKVYPLILKVLGSKLNRSGWTAYATSWADEWDGAYPRKPVHVLDNDHGTFWHSYYGNDMPSLPHYLVIDTKKECKFTQIEMRQRNTNQCTKYGKIFVASENNKGFTIDSNDGCIITINSSAENDWMEAGDFTMTTVTDQNLTNYQSFPINPTEGRYIIIKITESYNENGSVSLSEVCPYGMEMPTDD